jgi:ribosomal protein L20
MTKTIEEQANNKSLEYTTVEGYTDQHRKMYQNGYVDAAKSRDVEWLKVVNEFRESLNYFIGRVDEGTIRSKTTYEVFHRSLTKADQMIKEMGIEK